VCDVYVPANGAIKVVDFAPFHPATTDAILFSWDELGVQTADSDESTIAIRIVENPDMVPNLQVWVFMGEAPNSSTDKPVFRRTALAVYHMICWQWQPVNRHHKISTSL
jgi:hypothetical protein